MTAIAYRDGVMAADSHTVASDDSIKYSSNKLGRCGSYVFGVAGSMCPSNDTIKRWLFHGRSLRSKLPPMEGCDFSVLVAGPGGAILVDHTGGSEKIDAPFWAIGTGAATCMGAMEMGASAQRAVAAAVKHAPMCHGPVRVERVVK
jgi:hypothetical protein